MHTARFKTSNFKAAYSEIQGPNRFHKAKNLFYEKPDKEDAKNLDSR